MSVEKERELFELWCIKDDEFCIHRYAGSNDYSDDYTQCAWMAWQASANRHGYKLVPVEPTQEMLDKFPEVVYQDTYAGECSIWVGDETIRSGYKAMIGE